MGHIGPIRFARARAIPFKSHMGPGVGSVCTEKMADSAKVHNFMPYRLDYFIGLFLLNTGHSVIQARNVQSPGLKETGFSDIVYDT